MSNFCLVFMVHSPKSLGKELYKARDQFEKSAEQQDIKSLFVVTNPASGN